MNTKLSKKTGRFRILLSLLLLLLLCGCSRQTGPSRNEPKPSVQTQTDGKASLIKTYKQNRYVAVSYYVTAHGAVGDGIADDTAAIQAALDAAGQAGGGTVYIPAGRFRITSQLIIPEDVTLLGCFSPPTLKGSAAEEGTILVCEENAFTLSNSLILLGDNSALSDLTVWYEGQKYDHVKEYPYTIVQNSGESASITNIALINSWNGIMFKSSESKKITVANIYITAFGVGFNILKCSDRVILENINVSPIYWINSTLTETPKNFSASLLTDIMYENLCAIRIGTVSDTAIYQVNIDTAADGICFDIPSVIQGSAVASDFTIANTTRAVTIESAGMYGISFACCSFRTTDLLDSYAVKTGPNFSTSAVFNTCTFPGQPYTTVISEGTGKISFCDCKYTGWRNYALDIRGGVLSSSYNRYLSENPIGSFTDLAVGVFCNDTYTEDNYAEGNTFFTETDNEYEELPIQKSWLSTDDSIPYIRDAIWYSSDYGVRTSPSDATEDLQSLIDRVATEGGGIVFLEEGTYRISHTITVRKGVRLCGSSCDTKSGGKTVLLAPLALNDSVCVFLETGSSLTDISVAFNGLPDFTSLQEGETPSSFTVKTAKNADSIYIENVSLRAAPNGIYLDGTTNSVIKNVTGTAFFCGINAENCNELLLKNVTFDTRYADPYSVSYQQEHFIGFRILGGSEIKVLNCYVDNADYGILVNSGNAVTKSSPMIAVNALLSKNCYAGFCIEKSTLSVFVNTIAYCEVFDKNAYHGSTLSTSRGQVYLYNMICGGKATASLIVRGDSELFVRTCIFNGILSNTVRMLGGSLETVGCIMATNPSEYHISADRGNAVFMANLVNTSKVYDGLNGKYLRKSIADSVLFVDISNIKEYDAPRDIDY